MMEKTINNSTTTEVAEAKMTNDTFTDLVKQMTNIGMGRELPVRILATISFGDVEINITTSNAAARDTNDDARNGGRTDDDAVAVSNAIKLLISLMADANSIYYSSDTGELVLSIAASHLDSSTNIDYRRSIIKPITVGNTYSEQHKDGSEIFRMKISQAYKEDCQYFFNKYACDDTE